jgi:hypothetical protein
MKAAYTGKKVRILAPFAILGVAGRKSRLQLGQAHKQHQHSHKAMSHGFSLVCDCMDIDQAAILSGSIP